jgi:hypothetical protein
LGAPAHANGPGARVPERAFAHPKTLGGGRQGNSLRDVGLGESRRPPAREPVGGGGHRSRWGVVVVVWWAGVVGGVMGVVIGRSH